MGAVYELHKPKGVTTRDVYEWLNAYSPVKDDGKPWAYTTVMTVMRNLVTKGVLKDDKETAFPTYLYLPVTTRGNLYDDAISYLHDFLWPDPSWRQKVST